MNLSKRIIFLVIADFISALLAIPLAFMMLSGNIPAAFRLWDVKTIFFVLVVVSAAFFVELYKHRPDTKPTECAARIMVSLGVSLLLISSISYWCPFVIYGRAVVLLSLPLFGMLQFIAHSCYRAFSKFEGFADRVLILGTGPLAGEVGKVIPSSDGNYILSGYVSCTNDPEPAHVSVKNVLAPGGKLYEIVKREKACKIVVSVSERRGVLPLQEILNCKLRGIEVIDAPSFYEQMTGNCYLKI